MKKTLANKLISKTAGFTLIEIIVTVAIIGLLMTSISAIFINTLRNANQGNIISEAKENSSVVLDSLERDVRNASGAVIISPPTTPNLTKGPPSSNDDQEIQLTNTDGSTVYWRCVIENVASTPPNPPKSNGYIQRATSGVGNYQNVTNADPNNGISVSSCSFNISGSPQNLVTLNFTLTEGAAVHSASQDFSVSLPYTLSVGTRSF